ncbi:unnamed protein product [Brachionus calyciflorus]|uniref:Uncharacterized protein n=1 Tax=Brachionus calyciflorus TaxID=104777 RepID=A0A813RRE6_9BILA|nr:unnamed protein product [Brachionus calyciflorus]
MNGLSPSSSASNLKIIKTDFKPSGEAVQLVRPIVSNNKSTDQIVGELVNRFDYKTRDVKASENELNTVQQAFGSNLAQELIQSYDGSNLVADSQQDLVGERYLAEQIRLIQEQQRTTSVLDKWSHLLYEGERDYQSASKTEIPPLNLNEQYENRSVSNYSLLLEQQQAQQQAQYIQQLQQIQQQQRLQLIKQQQQLQEQSEQQKLRKSTSQNLASSYQRVASAASQSSGYVHSQSGLNGRTMSDLRLTQFKANELATAQYRAQYEAQLEAMTQAEVIAQAYAQAQAEAEAYAQARAHHHFQEQEHVEEQEQEPEPEPEQFQNLTRVLSRQSNNQVNQLRKSSSLVQQQQQHEQERQQQVSPKFTSANLNQVTIDAYNSPEFREMLEQLTKPLTIPPEQVNYPPEWPSQEKINLLAEPIYIPAPQPIVIPAPNILTLQDNSDVEKYYKRSNISETSIKPTVTYYPPIDNDQNQMKNFGIRQLNVEERAVNQQQ